MNSSALRAAKRGVEVADMRQVDAVVGEQFEFFAQRGQA
jgi:hypothetical protein